MSLLLHLLGFLNLLTLSLLLFFVLFLSFPLEKQVIGEQIRLMNLFFTLSKDDEHQVLNFFVNYSIFCRFMKKNFYVQNFYNYHFFFRFY